ncbi:hypothetical protein F8M41_018174 [Gigaspora margarita]|uniref:Uncharacterized protein n=1 Tax=Gigaspora margarita TaxID=4874 RepID=A0A8H4AM51_GIGMA|nr:hypothetical protein F8M41_018174 [Gigaspora margarita]
MLIEIKNTQDSILEILISDYVSQNCSYNVKVVFPTNNLQFNHLKTTIRLNETLIFIVGQMEIIANEFYVYANDINFRLIEDENVNNVKDYQPKTEKSVQDNQNSETNVESKKSSGKDKKRSTRVTHNSKM